MEPFGYVTTPNADHLVRLSRRPELMPLYQDAMLRLLDPVLSRGWLGWRIGDAAGSAGQ